MRLASAFICTVAVVQAFVPENVFRSASKSGNVLAPVKATHYDSIVETREVAVSCTLFSCVDTLSLKIFI